ncbi:MAG: polysaccharide pyruvyl transferase family protein [Fastidiosipila sp.]|nr:polysaccharide pyruvyl transferase family protein [Fastidiosipila sp.]
MKKILIVNRKHTDNLGDIAIGLALTQLFEKRGCEVYQLEFSTFGKDISSFGLNTNSGASETGAKAKISQKSPGKLKRFLAENFPKAIWFYGSGRHVIQQLREIPKDQIDLIVIGGGQLVQSERTNDKFAYAFKLWNWMNRHLLKTKLAVLGVGAKEDLSPYAAKVYKKALSHADFIYVRDHHSKEIVEQLKSSLEVKLMPDVAFSLYRNSKKQGRKEVERKLALLGIYDYDSYCKIHSLEAERSAYFEEWKGKIEDLSKAGYNVQLFYSTGTDKIETQRFSEYLGGKYEVAAANSLSDLFELLDSVDYVYSGRMHALILAMVSGCQVEAFITNTKLKIFAESYIQQSSDLKVLHQEIEQVIDTVLASLPDS